jgi:hypothetical protein
MTSSSAVNKSCLEYAHTQVGLGGGQRCSLLSAQAQLQHSSCSAQGHATVRAAGVPVAVFASSPYHHGRLLVGGRRRNRCLALPLFQRRARSRAVGVPSGIAHIISPIGLFPSLQPYPARARASRTYDYGECILRYRSQGLSSQGHGQTQSSTCRCKIIRAHWSSIPVQLSSTVHKPQIQFIQRPTSTDLPSLLYGFYRSEGHAAQTWRHS